MPLTRIKLLIGREIKSDNIAEDIIKMPIDKS